MSVAIIFLSYYGMNFLTIYFVSAYCVTLSQMDNLMQSEYKYSFCLISLHIFGNDKIYSFSHSVTQSYGRENDLLFFKIVTDFFCMLQSPYVNNHARQSLRLFEFAVSDKDLIS